MNHYEQKAYEEVQEWKRKLLKRSNLIKRVSKKAQEKINEKIPEKVHTVITDSIKNMVKMTVAGSSFTTKMEMTRNSSLEEREKKLTEKIAVYQKTATVEGAGTGAGGILLGLADFPLLLSIKMKFLFEAAAVYGFDTKEYEERLFILHIFQLAFSSEEKRKETLQVIENWEERKKEIIDMDWQEFQQEYRDYIDFVKMLQLVPGIGAIVGAYANYNLMEHLGEVAKNAYRIRILANAPKFY
ncbi:EcsC family protein [Robertmurraya massiliosenegalensis]|uniref:EcsC family protein n=1 Tax=Robertmurraya massiliosenegalensis TaxID=1287657 RepID=UPI00030C2388|nr:EcsC family protein [Robertmurraya massiliosenegalensis]